MYYTRDVTNDNIIARYYTHDEFLTTRPCGNSRDLRLNEFILIMAMPGVHRPFAVELRTRRSSSRFPCKPERAYLNSDYAQRRLQMRVNDRHQQSLSCHVRFANWRRQNSRAVGYCSFWSFHCVFLNFLLNRFLWKNEKKKKNRFCKNSSFLWSRWEFMNTYNIWK